MKFLFFINYKYEIYTVSLSKIVLMFFLRHHCDLRITNKSHKINLIAILFENLFDERVLFTDSHTGYSSIFPNK
jgi:hypothetical protein